MIWNNKQRENSNLKRLGLLILFLLGFVLAFSGCVSKQSESKHQDDYDSNYQAGYDEGYNDGYACGFEDGLNEDNYEDEYLEFQSTVISLMYDYEYEAVEKLFEYYPEAVGSFLENEFGTTDIPTIIEYLESERTLYPDTIVGKCKYCGEDVCHKDAIHWANIYDIDDRGLAHQNCYNENNPS
jgi:hypothetical protein